jgi:hypothetical protein
MKISFITTSLGVYGSIRELIENANRLVDYAHDVTIHSDLTNYPFNGWLHCKATLKELGYIDSCDALILMDSPFSKHMVRFLECDASFKTMIMMGFPLDFKLKLGNELYNYFGKSTESNLMHLLNNFEICADANWQLEHLNRLGVKTGYAIGGINLDQFQNFNKERTVQIGYSGDKRRRKLTSIIEEALELMDYSHDNYYKKGNQAYLVNFLNSCDLFLDNHMRAGWVNPVLEAMACGCIPICRWLPALEDFATSKTAIVLDKPDVNDFVKAVEKVINNEDLKAELRENAKEHIKQFSYDVITKGFEEYLYSKI